MQINPQKASNRIIYLDILRGMAIFFIYIFNIYVFSGWGNIPDDIKVQFSGTQLNTTLEQLTTIFVYGKWYSIFSILFGIGFVIQYENVMAKNRAFPSFFSKRMFGLLFFGLLHLFFLWPGDILTLYALIGFLLIYFRKHTNKQLLVWAAILLCLPTVHLLLMIVFDNFYPLVLLDIARSYLLEQNVPLEVTDGQANIYAFTKTWLDGENWGQLLTIGFAMPLIRFMMILIEGRIFKVLACFLIGTWAGRMILQHDLLNNTSLLKKITTYGLLIGLPMNILLAFGKTQPDGPWTIINSISYALGVVPLACSYAASVALLLKSGHQYLSIFAPVGQMAMSNYILQTIISIFIFYGVGFGLAFDLSLWQILLLALFVFVLQIILSTYWLRYFRYGPLEWLWRMMTYQKYIKIRK